jgi:hypothetical protein
MKLPHRRHVLHLAAGAAALPVVSRIAWAQAYPTRPVRIIVGFAAGGPADNVARLIGQWLSERLPSRQLLPGGKEYRNIDYHFSLKYPGDIPPQEWDEGGHALTVAFQKNAGEEGFQIYVAPINGTKIAEDRFLMDEPSGVRKDETKTSVDGTEALAFHAAMGQTYEVWFIKGGFIYEVSTYKELEPGLNEILSTWRFI